MRKWIPSIIAVITMAVSPPLFGMLMTALER